MFGKINIVHSFHRLAGIFYNRNSMHNANFKKHQIIPFSYF